MARPFWQPLLGSGEGPGAGVAKVVGYVCDRPREGSRGAESPRGQAGIRVGRSRRREGNSGKTWGVGGTGSRERSGNSWG